MKFEVFREIVVLLKQQSVAEHNAYEAKIELYNVNEPVQQAVSHLIGAVYGQEGKETFDWWCYEKEWGTRNDLKMTDREGNELCRTLEELHQYLEENKIDNYELPKKKKMMLNVTK